MGLFYSAFRCAGKGNLTRMLRVKFIEYNRWMLDFQNVIKVGLGVIVIAFLVLQRICRYIESIYQTETDHCINHWHQLTEQNCYMQAAVAMAVGVGSYSDPLEIPVSLFSKFLALLL